MFLVKEEDCCFVKVTGEWGINLDTCGGEQHSLWSFVRPSSENLLEKNPVNKQNYLYSILISS